MDNDHFVHRLRLEGRGGIPELTLLNATREPGEQAPVGAALGEASVWLSWTPEQSGPARLFLLPAAGSPPWAPLPPSRVIVATGSSLGDLAPVAQIEVSGFTNFVAEAGREYVVGVVGIYGGVFRAGVTPVPSNDEFSSPIVLASNTPSFLASTLGATASGFDPGSFQSASTVWWQWFSPGDGMLTYRLSQAGNSLVLRSFTSQMASRAEIPLEQAGTIRATRVSAGELVLFGLAGESWADGQMPVLFALSPLRLEVAGGPRALRKGVPATIHLGSRPDGVRFVQAGLGNVDRPLREAEGNDLTIVWTPDRTGSHTLRGFAMDDTGRIWATPEESVVVRPPNDDIADAQVLDSFGQPSGFSLSAATVEEGEPGPDQRSVWFSWTAQRTGMAGVGLSSPDSVRGARLRVYAGSSFADGLPVAERHITNFLARTANVLFPTVAGGRYAISVSGSSTAFSAQAVPQIELLEESELPLNDDFANRRMLAGTGVTTTNHLRYATVEAGESNAARSVWHQWTAPATGELFLPLDFAAGTAVQLNVSDVPSPGISVPGGSFFENGIRRSVQAGKDYYIRLIAWPTNPLDQIGPVVMRLRFAPSQADDLFPNRGIEAGEAVDLSGDTTAAGSEALPGSFVARTIWRSWTAPRTGTVMLWTIAPDDLEAAVYQGASLETLTQVGGGRATLFQPLHFSVTAGETYHFALGTGLAGFGGPVQAALRYYDALPANDAFASRLMLEVQPVMFPGLNVLATTEPTDPAGITNSLWWTWQPPANGWATLESCVDIAMSVFTGTGQLLPVPLENRESGFRRQQVRFKAERGQSYHLTAVKTAQTDLPYSVRLDLTSLAFASPESRSSYAPGEVYLLELEPLDTSLDGLPRTGTVRITQRAGSGDVLTDLPVMNELRWWVTNRTVVEALEFYATYTNTDGQVRTAWPLTVYSRFDSDNFGQAEAITNAAWRRDFLFFSSTRQPGDPTLHGETESGTLWCHWTAPHTCDVILEHSTWMGVFTGADLESLVAVSTVPLAGTHWPTTAFHAQRGVTYHFLLEGGIYASEAWLSAETYPVWVPPELGSRVWARDKIPLAAGVDIPTESITSVQYLLDGAVFALSWEPPWVPLNLSGLLPAGAGQLGLRVILKNGRTVESPFPVELRWKEPNDDFADASLVEGDVALVGVSNLHATREPDEPSHGADGLEWRWQQTLWWKYQAKTNGAVYVHASTQNGNDRYPPYLAAYDAGMSRVAGSPPGSNGNFTAFGFSIESGQTYYIASASRETNGLYLYFVTIPRLTNDDFSGAEPIPELPATVLARFGLATVQQGEQWPAEWEGRITQSLWWRLVSPGNGYLVVNVGDPNGPASSLYVRAPHLAGSGVAPLPSSYGLKTYPVQAGRSYWLALGRHAGGVNPEEAQVSFVSPATNDRFAQRLPVSGAPIRLLLPVDTCTLEVGEPAHPGVGHAQVRGSVWVSWTARSSGRVTLSAGGAAQLVVYHGNSLAGLFPLSANGYANCSFTAQTGSTYQIAVIAAKADPALVELSLDQVPTPPNDDFADATPVSGIKTRLQGNTWLATREFGEPTHGAYLGGSSCWWTWRAPVSGTVRLHTATPSNRPLAIAIYSGSQVNSLMTVPAASQDDGTALEFTAIAGQTYRIAVDDLNAWGGDVDLELAQEISRAQFVGPHQTSGGGFALSFTGPPGSGYVLERSVDFGVWSELASGFYSGDLQTWPVVPSEEDANEFFRLRTPGTP